MYVSGLRTSDLHRDRTSNLSTTPIVRNPCLQRGTISSTLVPTACKFLTSKYYIVDCLHIENSDGDFPWRILVATNTRGSLCTK